MQSKQESSESDQQIKKLLVSIQSITIQMSNTFEQAILRHQQQFIKTYRIKISQLIKLFEDLTKVLEDKFINNALTNRLNIVLKQRDYFKYQCLKLNVQYQTALNQHNSLSSQIINVTDQMKIYKHLLQDQKLKNKQLEKNAEKFKTNFNQMAFKTLTQNIENVNPKIPNQIKDLEKKNKKLEIALSQIQQKNELIRNLKIKVSELQLIVNERQVKYFQKKQLYQTYKTCVNAWKRDILTKQRKNNDSNVDKKLQWNPQKLNVSTKKDLLKHLFTSPQFLKFIQQLLFNPSFRVEFIHTSPEHQRYMAENRAKLFEYMHKKKIIGATNFIQKLGN